MSHLFLSHIFTNLALWSELLQKLPCPSVRGSVPSRKTHFRRSKKVLIKSVKIIWPGHKGNNVLLDSKAERSSEQTNTLSFCPRSCCLNLKQPQSGIYIRMQALASPVGARDAGGAGVLVMLKELVVFVGGIFEMVKSQNFFWWTIRESKNRIFCANKNLKILKAKSKIHLYFRVLHSIIPL